MALPVFFKGPVNRYRKKDDLISIAAALKISQKGTVIQLVARITTYLSDHSEALSTKPQFQGLYSYRPDNTPTGRPAKEGAPKTSVDKGLEDAHASESKNADGAAGAFKALNEGKVAHDPPPKHTHLRSTRATVRSLDAGNKAKLGSGNGEPLPGPDTARSSSSSPSLTPVSLPAAGFEDEGKDEGRTDTLADVGAAYFEDVRMNTDNGRTPVTLSGTYRAGEALGAHGPVTTMAHAGDNSVTIIVALQHQIGPMKGVTDEIHVQASNKLRTERRLVDGEEKHTIQLSQLLPAALENASTPTKKRGGRLFRPGRTTESGRVAVGTIQAVMNGTRIPQLESRLVNTYTLDPVTDEDDVFVCRLFLQDEISESLHAHQPAFQGSSLTSHAKPNDILCEPIAEVKSVQRVNARPENVGASMEASSEGDAEDFEEFLRELVGGPKTQWKKAKTIGDILQRCKAVERAMDVVGKLGWEKSKGGYLIAADYSDARGFAGRAFVKEDILKALRLGHSQANSDANLFKETLLKKLPDLQEWYDNPDGPQAKQFRNMSLKGYREYTERELRRLKKAKRIAKSRKAPHEGESDGRPAKKAKKGKEPARVKVVDSDDIDDSDSSELSD